LILEIRFHAFTKLSVTRGSRKVDEAREKFVDIGLYDRLGLIGANELRNDEAEHPLFVRWIPAISVDLDGLSSELAFVETERKAADLACLIQNVGNLFEEGLGGDLTQRVSIALHFSEQFPMKFPQLVHQPFL
jgi:hypothetical protein